MNTAFGLDLAGYSQGKTGFARADREAGKKILITVFRGPPFTDKLRGREPLARLADAELRAVKACLNRGCLVADVPMDLQGLPTVGAAQFTWELTLRPVDFAFRALPALADKIGAPVARFLHCLNRLDALDVLGDTLWETYPAASLELMGLRRSGYKNKSASYHDGTWYPVRPEDQPLADLLNELEWTADRGQTLNDDEFDAALCALTGVSDPEARSQGSALEDIIRERVLHKIDPVAGEHVRMNAPRGYTLLKRRPGETIRIQATRHQTVAETLYDIRQ